MEGERTLPKWIIIVCGFTTLSSVIISILGIFLHLKNYRKPFEQRLIVRILTLVPLFSISCYFMLMSYKIGRLIEPIREIYEAFTIYTFYKLLVLMLGGERRIILMTVNQAPTSHPFPASLFLKKVNISHPQHFLTIKRCILQYVWVKPLLYIIIFITSILGLYDVNDVSSTSIFVWLGICYNISVTTSLYSLAMFWKCLYDQLNVFNPWRKFMCVKLIIFASYWQGLIIGLLNWLGAFKEDNILFTMNSSSDGNLGIQIQNGLLCFEMIFFAMLHWNSFPYNDFGIDKFPDAGKMKTWIAMKDWICLGDLIHDICSTTMYGDSYNLRNFDALTDSTVYNGSDTFNQKIYQGLRISADGKKYWISIDNENNRNDFIDDNDNQDNDNNNNNNSNNNNNDNNNVYGKFIGSTIKGKQNIENQAKILMSNSNDRNDFNKKAIKTSDLINSYTPLLHDKKSSHEISRGYVTDINDLFDESNGSIFNESGSLADNDNQQLIMNEDLIKDEYLYRYVKSHYISEEATNYPVEYQYNLIDHSSRIQKLREQVRSGTLRDDPNTPDI